MTSAIAEHPERDALPEARAALGVVAGLLLWLLLGSLAEELRGPALAESRPQLNERSVASGLSLAVLGGFRAPAASLIFLDAHLGWQERDLRRTERQLQLALDLDPRPVEYWLRAARIIALDFPHWQFAELRASGVEITRTLDQRIRRACLQQGLEWLERAAALHPETPELPLEKARLWLTVFRDRRQALLALEDVVKLPQAPYFAHRLYADLLEATGKPEAALAYLEAHYAALPPKALAPDAQHDYVLSRIAELRASMRVPSN